MKSGQERGDIRLAVVAQAEAYVWAHLDCPVPVARLCRLVGISERGLRNAFYRVHGVSPKRWMVTARLQGAQTALRRRRDVPITVTSVATDHGFYQLGKFSAIYKKTFGEAPSKTLHSASLAALPPAAGSRGEHANACSR
jgi:transcriptional regulator GlxA family with amidase domain